MPIITQRTNWLRFALFYHRQLPSFGLTGHYAFAPRSTLHASPSTTPDQRVQIVRKPSPAGYRQTPTAELGKTERNPISTIGPSIQYVTESGDPVGKIKLLWAPASWCARTGGRRPFSRAQPSRFAHGSAPTGEHLRGYFLVERNSFRFSRLLADLHHLQLPRSGWLVAEPEATPQMPRLRPWGSLWSAPATQASFPSWDTTNHGGVQ